MDSVEVRRRRRVNLLASGAAYAATHLILHVIIPALSANLAVEEQELPLRRKKRKSHDIPRVRNYLEIVHALHGNEFQAHFRLSREAFEWLLGRIGSRLVCRNDGRYTGRGRPIMDSEKQLLAILWLLATPDSFRSVACRFNTSKGSLHATFLRVIQALTWLSPQVVRWPDVQERQRIRQSFKDFAGLDGVVAVVDGTYVPIKAPSKHNNPSSYVNRKCFYGMTMQGICDDKRRFLDAFAGYPSSVSDTRIFQNSPIVRRIEAQPERYFSDHEFMIGDKAYETKTYCVPPYKRGRQYDEWQSNFNQIQSRCRQVIERTFALFFGRFRRFKYVDMSRTDWIPPTIIAGVVLHNICLTRESDELQSQFEAEGTSFLETQSEADVDEPSAQAGAANRTTSNQNGRLFRDQLAREMGLLPAVEPEEHDNDPDDDLQQYVVLGDGEPDGESEMVVEGSAV